MNPIINKLFYADKWNIGYVDQTPHELIKNKGLAPQKKWLVEDGSLYAADPFVINNDSGTYIFYEDLPQIFNKGQIKMIKHFSFPTKLMVRGFAEKVHLSYPYIFKDKDTFYCIPESSELKQIALYEFTDQSFTEVKKRTLLLEGEPFVDSSITWFNNKYWLFTSVKGFANQFRIYYADALTGPFLPHALNPITHAKKQVRGAGSLFVVDGVLYRPTQNVEFKYGNSVIINKITDLTETTYYSEAVFEILPEKPYGEGLHNISVTDNLIVFDGKRRVFSSVMPLKKLVRKLLYYNQLLFR